MENTKGPSESEFVFDYRASDDELYELEDTVDVLIDVITAELTYEYKVRTENGSYLKLSFFDSEAAPKSNNYQIVLGDGPGNKTAVVYSFDSGFNFMPHQSRVAVDKRFVWEVMADLNRESCPIDKDERDILNCITESLRHDSDPEQLSGDLDGTETLISMAEVIRRKVLQKAGYVMVHQALELQIETDRLIHLSINETRLQPLDNNYCPPNQGIDVETRIDLVDNYHHKEYVFTRHSAFPATLETALIDPDDPEYIPPHQQSSDNDGSGEIARYRQQIKRTGEIPLKDDVLYLNNVLATAFDALMEDQVKFN